MDEKSIAQIENNNQQSKREEQQQRQILIGIIVLGVVILVGIGITVYFLLQNSDRTMLIRDVMVTLLAFEMFLVGITGFLLILQITKLVNLIQNEIKTLLESANETIYTLRGTAAFISDSFVQPVMKFNGYIAAVRRALDLLSFK